MFFWGAKFFLAVWASCMSSAWQGESFDRSNALHATQKKSDSAPSPMTAVERCETEENPSEGEDLASLEGISFPSLAYRALNGLILHSAHLLISNRNFLPARGSPFLL